MIDPAQTEIAAATLAKLHHHLRHDLQRPSICELFRPSGQH
jgi:hypothetical protein